MKREEKDKKLKFELTNENLHFLLMSIDAGLIQFHNVQNVMSSVFFLKESEQKTTDLMERITAIRQYLVSVSKPKDTNKLTIEK